MADIFVLLPAHRDAEQWARDFARGLAADRSPWGFSHARALGYDVRFSKGSPRSFLERLARRVLDFDAVHAWRNRNELRSARIIWTHTELEYQAAALVLRLTGSRAPVLLGNTLWLFHDFAKLPIWRRAVARFCMSRVDILTCNAMPNVHGISGVTDITYVPYGISIDSFPLTKPTARTGALIVAIGNDRARDWAALRDVAQRHPEAAVRIASSYADEAPRDLPNVTVAPTNGVEATRELYRQAALVLVPVTANWHASGITVILEAVASGVPVIAAREGGLDAYFTDDEIVFYGRGLPIQSAADAVSAVLADPVSAAARAQRAQERFVQSEYDSRSFIKRLTAVTMSKAKGRLAIALPSRKELLDQA